MRLILVIIIAVVLAAPARVNAAAANARLFQPSVAALFALDQPSPLAARLSKLQRNEPYPIVGRSPSGDWLAIHLKDGQTAWVPYGLGHTNEQRAALPIAWGVKETPLQSNAVAPCLPVYMRQPSAWARVAPERSTDTFALVSASDSLVATGRSANGQWVQTRAGWLPASQVRAQGALSLLRVVQQTGSAGDMTAPRCYLRPLWPAMPAIGQSHQRMYQRSVAAGRAANVFTILSDSTVAPVFRPLDVNRLDEGRIDASTARELKPIAQRFGNALTRDLLAVRAGFNSASVFKTEFSDPARCARGETPIACDFRVSNASVVFIALGTNDAYEWKDFEARLRRILDFSLAQHVTPVLMTKADTNESGTLGLGVFNNIIRSLGAEYGLPVLDLWEATRGLPSDGVSDEDHFHLNDYGLDARLMLMLKALSTLTR